MCFSKSSASIYCIWERVYINITYMNIDINKRKLMQRINVAGNPYCSYAYKTYVIVVEFFFYQLRGILEH